MNTGPAAQATQGAELPEAWQPKLPPDTSFPRVGIPERETNDYAELAAWYSGFSFSEHYRKVIQSQCQEMVRARYAVAGEKISETRIESLARLEPAYLNYLERQLYGRILWEREFLAQGGMR
jgi:hypothetical protein